MIKFFRKIRQNLILENQTGKYLKYAIGEIVLVVIGILIALQINNWNEERKNRNYENQLLVQLQNDLKLNIKDLKLNLSLQEKTIESSKLLSMHINNKSPYHDSLAIHFSNTGIWTKFVVSEGAYKTIESKGLDLISNLELRDLIFRIYQGNLYWVKHMENIIINQVEDFRTNKASSYFTEYNAIAIIDGEFKNGNTTVFDYNAIINDPRFLYYLNSVKNQNEMLLEVSKGFLEDNLQGIEMIDSILTAHSK